ncbi:MAG: sigma-70 family RNA polymerase sigma factor, partial [Actinomycetota bacterium]|nr:sigma-70 family RNA polymerase sigma factor [Actinomycetota bacterium]
MDDAQLVAAVLAGDRTAYAALYDRYADRIHDFGASILRNRADASDALQVTFLIAFEALDALAQPARLRSWLYAIAHRAVLDRIEGEGRLPGRDGGQVGDLIPGPGSTEPRLSRAELAEFVWQAAGGLPQRDQILLDLHLRQGLEERDLAGAAGVPVAQLDPVLERLEAQSERALGALLVARTGRRSCPSLSGILGEWDGQLTPEFRDRVTAHVDDCELCNSRRRIAPSPLGLLAATPMAPAPAYLRSVVLGKAELEALERTGADGSGRMLASAGWAFGGDGFPDLRGGDRPRPVVPARPVHPRSPPPAVSAPTAPGPRIGIGSE